MGLLDNVLLSDDAYQLAHSQAPISGLLGNLAQKAKYKVSNACGWVAFSVYGWHDARAAKAVC